MAVIDIDFPGNLASVATVADLRAVPSSQFLEGDLYITRGGGSIGDFLGGLFAWRASSLTADNGVSVIKPNDITSLQAGRWIAIGYIGAGGMVVAPTLAALKALPTSAGVTTYDGALFNWTLGDYSTTAAADIDVSVVQATGTPLTTGAWIRQSATKMTFQRTGSPIIRTGGGKLRDRNDAFDWIPVSLHSAIRAGTSMEPIANYLVNAVSGTGSDSLYFGRGQYGWEQELDMAGTRIVGSGRDRTTLVSLTPGVRSFFKVRGQNALIDGLYMQADNFLYGVWPEGANGTDIVRCSIEAAKIAGVKYAPGGNNSSGRLQSNLIRFNGRTYSVGNGTIPSGGGLFNITGLTVNPTTLVTAGGTGPRIGYDFAKVGSNPAWEIVGATATTLTVYAPQGPGITAGTFPVSILQGSGVEISRQGDNSDIKLYNNAIQSNALAGIDNLALYGTLGEGNTLEFNHYATVSGRRSGGGEQTVINSTFDTNYAEANGGGAGYYIGSVRQFVIRNLMADGVAYRGLDNVRIADRLTMYDMNLQTSGINATKRDLYEASSTTPIVILHGSNNHFENPAGNVTVTIENIPTSNASAVASFLDVLTTFLLGKMNGFTFTIRSSTVLVNDVAMSGGFSSVTVPAGNGRRVIVAYESTYGLRVTYGPAAY